MRTVTSPRVRGAGTLNHVGRRESAARSKYDSAQPNCATTRTRITNSPETRQAGLKPCATGETLCASAALRRRGRRLLRDVEWGIEPHAQDCSRREIDFIAFCRRDRAAATDQNPRERTAHAAENAADDCANTCAG